MAGPFYFAWVGGVASPAFALTTTGDVWGGSLETFGDIWGGEFIIQGDVTQNSNSVTNIVRTEGLIVGNTYSITGEGIPVNADGSPSVTFTYTGGNSITMSSNALGTHPGASLTVRNSDQIFVISNVANIAQLVNGQTYGVAGPGIQPGTTFVFGGSNSFTLSLPATSTTPLGRITITLATGANVITNLANVTGLVVGETYSIWGPGIPSGCFFTYAGGTSVTLTASATITNVGVFLSIRKGLTEDDGGAFDSSTMLVEDEKIFRIEIVHAEGDFPTLLIEIQNPEIGLLGPGQQLWCWLSWDSAWIEGVTSNPSNVVPLFHGRIVGVPKRLTDEIVSLEFVARPVDYFVQKTNLANTLKVLPYWDPIWLQRSLADPDTALEAYTLAWHIDRVTLVVTTSDILNAEDGTITIAETDHFYEGIDVSYSQAPLTSVSVSGTVTWTQDGAGDVDLTDELVGAFQAAGSPWGSPIVGSYTGDGLLTGWPKPNAGIGGGWTMGQNSTAVSATAWLAPQYYAIKYASAGGSLQTSTLPSAMIANIEAMPYSANSKSPYGYGTTVAGTLSSQKNPGSGAASFFGGSSNWDVTFTLSPIAADFLVHYDASRKRSEVIVFTLGADVQPVLVEPDGSDTEIIELNSAFVDQPVDAGGALPIGDTRRNSYFPTDRGQQSLQYLLLLARAKLAKRSRIVDIKFQCPWSKIVSPSLNISCRMAVLIEDRRLPGGQALGKVTNYTLQSSGEGSGTQLAEVRIECAVGMGNTLPTASAGTDSYATDYATDYTQAVPGTAQIDVIPGVLQYDDISGTYVLDDDGLDLFNMVPSAVIQSLTVFNGPSIQKAAIDAGATQNKPPVNSVGSANFLIGQTLVTNIIPTTNLLPGTTYEASGPGVPAKATLVYGPLANTGTLSAAALVTGHAALTLGKPVTNDPVAALAAAPTQVDLQLVPVTGGDFYTQIPVNTSDLALPQGINLAAT